MIKTKKIKLVFNHIVCSCLSLVNVLFMFFASQNTRNQKQNIVFGLKCIFVGTLKKVVLKCSKLLQSFSNIFTSILKFLMSHVKQ